MKTGKDVVDRALRLLGYTNTFGEVDSGQDAEIFKRASASLNQVFFDLYRIENNTPYTGESLSLTEIIPLSTNTVNDIMPYGVAMFIAQSEGNGDAQGMFAELYNMKRSATPKAKHMIKYKMPRGGY